MIKTNVVIILGGGVNQDGSLGKNSKERLDYFLKNKTQFSGRPIILSGKHCGLKLFFKPQKTEAEAMKEHLIKNNVSEELLFLENKSKHTINNAIFSKKIIDNHHDWGKNIAIITSDWHMERAMFIFKNIFRREYNFLPLKVSSASSTDEKKYEKLQKIAVKIILNLWVKYFRAT